MSRTRRSSWVPPFAVGVSAAVAGEVSVGLLLYITPGFVRALTLILAVLLISLALGLWTAPTANDEALPDRLRRRWLLALSAYAIASVVSGVWAAQGGLAAQAWTRGLGLALLAALPLYSCGALLGGMSAPRFSSGRVPVGAAAAAGAALGTTLAGYVLVAAFPPVQIFALCLVLLSVAALVHGADVTADGERHTVHSEWSPYGLVTVEDWSWGKSRRERILTENGRLRGAENGDGLPVRRWEKATLELLAGLGRRTAPEPATRAEPSRAPSTASVLVLGGGAFTLARQLLAGGRDLHIDIAERNGAVLTAAGQHFAAPGNGPRVRVLDEDPTIALIECPGPYDAIVIDAAAVAPQDPLPVTHSSELRPLAERLAPGGMVLIGGIDPEVAAGVPLKGVLEGADEIFPTIAVFGPGAVVPRKGSTRAPDSEIILVFSLDPAADFPASAGELAGEVSRRVVSSGTPAAEPPTLEASAVEQPPESSGSEDAPNVQEPDASANAGSPQDPPTAEGEGRP